MNAIFSAYRQAYSGLPRATWLVAGVALVNRSGTMVLPFLTLYLTEKQGYETATAGLFVMLYGIGGLLGTWMGGRLTDRFGPVRVQTASLLITTFQFFLLGYWNETWLIAGGLFFLALFGEAFRPASATLVAMTCRPEQRTRAYALQRLAVNLGMAIGPAVGGWLATASYLWLFWVDGGTCLIAAVLLWRLFRNFTPLEPPAPPTQEQTARGPWQDRIMMATMALTLVLACVFFQLVSTVPLYLTEGYGMTKATLGTLLALNPVVIVAFEMLLVQRLQHSNPLRPMGIGALLVGLGFGMLPWGNTLGFATLALLVWTMGEMLESPLLAGFISNRAHDGNRGRYMATMGLVYSTAIIIAPAAGSWIYERLGPTVLWTGCAVLGTVVCVAYWILARSVDHERQKAQPPFTAPRK
jgi:predicted MFS family arabinose efflux permease